MHIYKVYNSEIDDTVKYQFHTDDNYVIEACLIYFQSEIAPINICISSQIGCMCKCSFCATGHKRFIRNLNADEIISQVELIFSHSPVLQDQLFEITYMGTGDPFNNIHNVLTSITHFENKFLKLHRINISTIIPHIRIQPEHFIKTRIPIHFQYSLHFLSDELRNKYFQSNLVPINDAIVFLNEISKQTQEDFCINYLLFDQINDSAEDAEKLIELAHKLNAYIKVSQYCPISNSRLRPSQNFISFTNILDKKGIRWKPFQSKGIDIKASCGHLLSDVDF